MKVASFLILLVVWPLIPVAKSFGQQPAETSVYPCDLSDNLIQLLSVAVSKNDDKCVRQLLQKGIDPNAQYEGDITHSPIVMATAFNYPKVVAALCEAGFDWKSEEGELAIALASYNGRREVIKEFLRAKMPVDLRGKDGKTPLMYAAAARSNIATVTLLVENGADPNLKTVVGTSALMVASDEEAQITTLLAAGGGIEAKDNAGQTAVFYALKRFQPRKLKALLENKANPNAKDLKGMTPLKFARRLPNSDAKQEMIDLLVQFAAK